MNITKLLDQYDKIINRLNDIENMFDQLKNNAKIKIKHSNSNKEKKEILTEFKSSIQQLSFNKNIRERYNSLLKNKQILRDKMINTNFKPNIITIDNSIFNKINKYDIFNKYNIKLTHYSLIEKQLIIKDILNSISVVFK